MGVIGAELGSIGGSYGGSQLGHAIGLGDEGSQVLGAIGGVLGGALGTIFPFFKTGGGVKGSRKTSHLVILHGKETVLPANVHATKQQEAVIRSNKLKQKKGSSVYSR